MYKMTLQISSIEHSGGISFPFVPTGNTGDPFHLSFLIYVDDTLFKSARLRKLAKEADGLPPERIASSVVSLTIKDVDFVNITEPIVIEFKVIKSMVASVCAFVPGPSTQGTSSSADGLQNIENLNVFIVTVPSRRLAETPF